MVHHPFTPSFVIDVSAVWSHRMDAVSAYESQFGRETHRTEIGGETFLAFLEARARFYGAMAGVEHGEAFYSPGPIALDALPGLHRTGGDKGASGPPGYRSFA
jgi:hypothetical protein